MPEPGEKSIVALVLARCRRRPFQQRVGKRVTRARSAHGGGRPVLINNAPCARAPRSSVTLSADCVSEVRLNELH
jgi:hypothetical protein